ncbi:Phosphopantetheine adenylyltransferase [Lachnospiraceae bacterium XBB1006]|nr:Phosphopantetheine adenylyltransferase [Lachnospiraceae bacterium XBB1006]
MGKAIYPGSFDPITNGHLDIVRRAARMFDEVYVGVLINSTKNPLFSMEERVSMLEEVLEEYDNVKVVSFDGLLVDYCRQNDIHTIIRGLRAITDFEYELQIAQTNRVMAPEVDTVFLATSLQYSYLSSSIVKEMAMYDADISKTVPESVKAHIQKKIHART